jgi:hypothetical protein
MNVDTDNQFHQCFSSALLFILFKKLVYITYNVVVLSYSFLS